jgi:hypothetical protein
LPVGVDFHIASPYLYPRQKQHAVTGVGPGSVLPQSQAHQISTPAFRGAGSTPPQPISIHNNQEDAMSRLVCFRLVLAGVILALPCALAQAQDKTAAHVTDHADHIMVAPKDLKWVDGPASLPKGVKAAVLEGDPTKAGPFTMRIKLPANYKISPHWHPAIEHVTVLSGSFYMGTGEVFDESKATKLPVGGFAVMQTGTRHFAFSKEEAVIQLHGIGPWGITYVNPADDPRNQAGSQ